MKKMRVVKVAMFLFVVSLAFWKCDTSDEIEFIEQTIVQTDPTSKKSLLKNYPLNLLRI